MTNKDGSFTREQKTQLWFFLWNAQFGDKNSQKGKRGISAVLLFIFKLEVVDCFHDKQEKVFLPSAVSF